MKTLFKPFLLLAITAIAFASCSKSDDYDYEKAREQARIEDSLNNVRIQKIIAEQAPSLEKFAKDNFDTPEQHDSLGIWFDIVNPGQAEPFQYKINNGSIAAPTITVIYRGTLLDGTEFDKSDKEATQDTVESATFSLGGLIAAWQHAFLPQNISYNGYNTKVPGLTTNGLRRGSIIRFVTPSPWGYDTKSSGKIPANSPLYFEIEVVDITY